MSEPLLVVWVRVVVKFTTGQPINNITERCCDLVLFLYFSFFFLRFGISRQAQDEFALRSHQNSAKAHADGIYADEVHMVFNQILYYR